MRAVYKGHAVSGLAQCPLRLVALRNSTHLSAFSFPVTKVPSAAMTTTITTGVLAGTAGGAGLAGLAVAGAVGLGVLGVAALASRGGGRRNRGGRRNGHRRGRRSTVEDDDDWRMQNALELVRAEDVTGCGMRLVCELASQEEEDLVQEELAILALLGPDVKPGEGVLPPGGARGEYLQARSFGGRGGDCGAAFPMCPHNGTQLMDTVMAYLP
ncbi:uncharacterized protein LOC125030948 [Penaeus chinensis]|uniref:uncharacterized protein LOC125030948 n=1 Tax=Penaeus chinensis TaxID=139456 RepID=UPI001FB5ACC1|nr:uncharacterized protein LOC125030948 [Penaeus chinensis]